MRVLERTDDLHRLDALLRQAVEGEGALMLLGGEAGVGKTTFAHLLCKQVSERARVLTGACDPLSTPRPLGPLLDIAAALGGGVDRLVVAGTPRADLFGTVLAALGAGSRPTLLIVEDAHWADEATLDLLRYLGRRIGAMPILVVVTYRDDEVTAHHPLRIVMGDLATARTVHRHSLRPLSEDAVRTLAENSPIDPALLFRQTGGNPFFVTEVLAGGAPGVPPTVRDAVLTRVSRLSPAGQATLDAAAIIGLTVEPWLLAEVTGADAGALDECLAAGLLRIDGDMLAFRHELTRVAIRDELTPIRAANVHQRVLVALRARTSTPIDLSRLAHHAVAAGDRSAILELAPAAARHAAGLRAHREAAAHYASAVRYANDVPPDERAALLEAWRTECDLTDRLDDAITAGEALLDLARAAGNKADEAEHLSRLAQALVRLGRNADAEQASQDAIALLSSLPAGPGHARIFATQAHLRMLHRDAEAAIAWGERAITANPADVEIQSRALNTIGSARLLASAVDRGRRDLERSLVIAREAGLDDLAARAYVNLGSACGEIFRLSLADHYLSEGIAFATEHDLDSQRLYMTAWLALTRLYQGRWSDVAACAATVLEAPGAAVISRIMALVALGRLRARSGAPGVWESLDEALALAAPTATLQRLAPVRAARAEAAWLAGDRKRAAAEAQAVFELAVTHRHPWHMGELAYWRWRAGERIAPPPGAAEPFALQMQGDWAGAAARWQAIGCGYESARALAESDEENALRGALATFQRLGARPATAMVTKSLRRMGARGIPRGPRPATRANRALLTPRELEILTLLAAAKSNVEIADDLFISPRTVERHITAILGKLGASSRLAAVRTAIARGLLPPM